ncbi:MAG: hypothetical protein Q9M13_03380 [Mariprofundales bacterium]|nr:hypothetical protein [Mariprofundales bacterium]
MPVQTQQTILVQKEVDVTVTHLAISQMEIDLEGRRIEVTVKYGHYVDGKFETLTERTFTISDSEGYHLPFDETLYVVNGSVTLTHQPAGNLVVREVIDGGGSQILFQGDDYTVEGNIITLVDTTIQQVRVTYDFHVPAQKHYATFVFYPVSTDHSLAGNTQAAVWSILKDMGVVGDDMTIVPDATLL